MDMSMALALAKIAGGGGGGGSDEIFIINVTASLPEEEGADEYICTSDKTVAEITAAFESGKVCTAVVTLSDGPTCVLPLYQTFGPGFVFAIAGLNGPEIDGSTLLCFPGEEGGDDAFQFYNSYAEIPTSQQAVVVVHFSPSGGNLQADTSISDIESALENGIVVMGMGQPYGSYVYGFIFYDSVSQTYVFEGQCLTDGQQATMWYTYSFGSTWAYSRITYQDRIVHVTVSTSPGVSTTYTLDTAWYLICGSVDNNQQVIISGVPENRVQWPVIEVSGVSGVYKVTAMTSYGIVEFTTDSRDGNPTYTVNA